MSTTNKSSYIWSLFNIDETDDTFAVCKLCNCRLKRGKNSKAFSTTPLIKHASAKHSDEFKAEKDVAEGRQQCCPPMPPPPKIRKLNAMAQASEEARKIRIQLKLPQALENVNMWGPHDPRTKAVNRKVIQMIVSDNQPFTIVEDTGFVNLIAHLQPKYCMPSRRYFSETMLPRLYEESRKTAVRMIEKAESLAFTSDIWTASTCNEAFVSLSAHWIDDEFKRQSLVLNAKHFPERHTGQNIADMFQEMFTEWKIQPNRRHCLVRDGAANMELASDLAGLTSVHCFIHALQLVVHDAVLSQRAVVDMLARTRKLVTHFSHSSLACTALKDLQKQDATASHSNDSSSSDTVTVLLPVQDVSTRWNSTYLMCERAIKIKRSLQLYLADHDQVQKLSANDWILMEKLVYVLKPFFDLTQKLSSDNSSISRVIVDVILLDDCLATMNDANTAGVQTTRDELRKALAARFRHNRDTDPESILNSKPAALASILDPRYKLLFFPTKMKQTLKGQVIDALSQLVSQSRSPTPASTVTPVGGESGGDGGTATTACARPASPTPGIILLK
jgi:hypothetical protein